MRRSLAVAFGLVGILLLALPSAHSLPEANGTEEPPASEAGTSGSTSEEAVSPDSPVDPGPGPVLVLRLDDRMINRGSKDYLLEGFQEGMADPEVRAIVLIIDTPGGTLDATRILVKEMLASTKPIVTYIAPIGSRGASAGVFITMAGHVAAMAPATHLGAAHPVFLGPSPSSPQKDEDEEKKQEALDSQAAMLEKVTEDTVSFARNIAEIRGRNADWAEDAVRNSVTLQVGDAVEQGVVDLEAVSLDALLETVDGRVVELADGSSMVLRTRGTRVERPMRAAQAVLYMLTDPTVAYLLLMAGLLGLGIEFRSPGLVLPGVLGGISLLLALFSLSALPVNLVAFLFVVLGGGLIVTDLFIPSHGLLSIGGVAFLAFGGLFLIDKTPEVPVGVSPTAVIGVTVVVGVLALALAWLLVGDHKRKVHTANEGIIGERGRVLKRIPEGPRAEGRILVLGERWTARAVGAVEKDSHVIVRKIEGLVLTVEPDEPTDPDSAN